MKRVRKPRRWKCATKDGRPKEGLTYDHARLTRERIIEQGASPEAVRIYECNVCGKWHVGHHADNARRTK